MAQRDPEYILHLAAHVVNSPFTFLTTSHPAEPLTLSQLKETDSYSKSCSLDGTIREKAASETETEETKILQGVCILKLYLLVGCCSKINL